MKNFKDEIINSIRKKLENTDVLCGLSGGVDSTVTAVLVHKAIGNQLKCLFVDTGLMRMNEAKVIQKLFVENFNIQLDVVNSSKSFFTKLSGLKDPEKKKRLLENNLLKYLNNILGNKKILNF